MIENILQEKIIRREIYLSKILDFWNSKLIKVITGMRRAGKSYILKSIIQEITSKHKILENNIFYIDKDIPQFKNINNYDKLNKTFQEFLKKIDKNKKIIVAIDEVQEIQEWELFVNGYLTQYQNKIEIFITGSNSTMFSGELATRLAGRYVEFEIFPLNFTEYALFSEKEKTRELFKEYLKYGGLPGIFNIKEKNEELVRKYLQDVYSAIILKDIVKFFRIRNIHFFEELFSFTFANIGNVLSAKSISDYLKNQNIKIGTDMVLEYLSYGTKVYLLNQIKSLEPTTKKYFEIYNKYYIGDIGLRNAIVGYNLRKDNGKLLENFVYLELRRYGYEIKIGRLKDGQEIDFVTMKNGIIKYFQVCYLLNSEETIEREYTLLEKIKDNWEKYVISFDELDFGVRNGIRWINVMELEKVL